jgi:hypothetical protein
VLHKRRVSGSEIKVTHKLSHPAVREVFVTDTVSVAEKDWSQLRVSGAVGARLVPPPSDPGGATHHRDQQMTSTNVVRGGVWHLILGKIMYLMISCSEHQ